MALLEPSDKKEVKVEESLNYRVNLDNAVTLESHVEYLMTVVHNGSTWSIQRRYTDFRVLHQTLCTLSGMDLDFPGKKMTGNKDRDFVALRQNALQNFISFVTTHSIMKHSLALKKFLNPATYPSNISGMK